MEKKQIITSINEFSKFNDKEVTDSLMQLYNDGYLKVYNWKNGIPEKFILNPKKMQWVEQEILRICRNRFYAKQKPISDEELSKITGIPIEFVEGASDYLAKKKLLSKRYINIEDEN